jgi:bacillithiol biosynthesis cysteine-adding enzyme BshC
MDDCTYISYSQTGYFSKIVTDYVSQAETLKPFYLHAANPEGIKAAIENRKLFPTNRKVLVEELEKQYGNLILPEKVKENLALLLQEKTFTITTAHQPNIFTGPLYVVYKTLHAVKLAQYLSAQFSQYNFVPVYYMGSEDADLDELGSITVQGKKYTWDTQQTGAVGRMKVDENFIALLETLHEQVSAEPYGEALYSIFKQAYTIGKTIQQATLELLNSLYGAYGLIVLIPDNANLKKLFEPVVAKELTEQFSHKEVEKTIANYEKDYKVQAGGRDLNLFYLIDDKRERIQLRITNGEGHYEVKSLNLYFTKEEILHELKAHPERFSANVILRGAFQETVLPGIAFIGGGGELAYWLELKNVFKAVDVPYPVLLVRNSFLLIDKKQIEKTEALQLSALDLFDDEQEILNTIIRKEPGFSTSLDKEKQQLKNAYEQLTAIASRADITLQNHVNALCTKALKKIDQLENKILRAERRKHKEEQIQLQTLRQTLFPNNSLQERIENFSAFYAEYSNAFFQNILNKSLTLEQQFGIVELS